MKFLFKYPSRNRKDLFKSTFGKWKGMLSGKHGVEFLISLDRDDEQMNTPEMHGFLDSQSNTTYCFGESTSKVEAINANMDSDCAKKDWETVVLISDDMIPQVHGYDDIIATEMNKNYDDFSGAIWFNDGLTGNVLCTLSILGRKLFDRFGYLYHPDYKSLFCDNEFQSVCQSWGKMTYVDDVIIRHAWVDATGADALHLRNQALNARDKRMYEARRAVGFPNESVAIETSNKFRDRRR